MPDVNSHSKLGARERERERERANYIYIACLIFEFGAIDKRIVRERERERD